MNRPTDPLSPPPSAPVLEIPADQVEVLAADAPAGAPPVKAAEVRSVTLGPKEILAGKRAQLYHQVGRPVRLLGVELEPSGGRVALHKIMAGLETLDFSDGKTFVEVYPDGVDVPENVFLTSVVHNPGEEPVRARVVYVLRDREGKPGEAPAAPARARLQSGSGPSRSGPRRSGPGPVPSAGGGTRRVGPRKRREEPGPKRTQHSRIGGSTQAPAVRTKEANSRASLSPMVRQERDRTPDPGPRTTEIALAEGEVAVHVERFRMPAMRDLARRGVPLPPDHTGAVQRALRKPGEGPGDPVAMTGALAERILKVLSNGGRLSTDEREELGRALDGKPASAAATAVEAPTAAAETTS